MVAWRVVAGPGEEVEDQGVRIGVREHVQCVAHRIERLREREDVALANEVVSIWLPWCRRRGGVGSTPSSARTSSRWRIQLDYAVLIVANDLDRAVLESLALIGEVADRPRLSLCVIGADRT